MLRIVLPVGISFYTFQAMSYTIDIYRGETEPTRSFSDFALFVCFFPHLVAGPIMRAHTLLPQVVQPRRCPQRDVPRGAARWCWSACSRRWCSRTTWRRSPTRSSLRCADGDTSELTGSEVLVGIYAFAFQIYGDFSGYSTSRAASRSGSASSWSSTSTTRTSPSRRATSGGAGTSACRVAARLPVHPAGRQPARACARVPQPDAHDAARVACGTERTGRSSSGASTTASSCAVTASPESVIPTGRPNRCDERSRYSSCST